MYMLYILLERKLQSCSKICTKGAVDYLFIYKNADTYSKFWERNFEGEG